MLNYLWAGMILFGILWGTVNGRLDQVTLGAINGAGEGVALGITMLGILSFWNGILNIGQASGLVTWLAGKMDPVLTFLFPSLEKDHPAREYIAVNMIANLLGLGSAATPAGLKAMEELEKLEEDRRAGRAPGPRRTPGTAGNEMCTFLIVNISSLQLIPVTIIAYRSQYGSADPAGITGPALLATGISTAAGVIFCRMMDKNAEKYCEKR